MISSETVPSVGIIVPSILSLNHICQDMKPLHLTDVVGSLVSGLQQHLMPLIRQKYHQEAAALDPRFKMKWCRTPHEETRLQDQLDTLAQELRINNPSPASYFKADENTDSKANSSYEQASKRRKLFSFLEKPDDKETKRSSALLVEFNDFVREQLLLEYDCPLRYWLEKSGTYRCLAQLAYYLCSIPACPPPIDKVFLEWTVSANSSGASGQTLDKAAALDPRFKMKWCRTPHEETRLQDQLDTLAQELRINNPSPASYFKADENTDSKANSSYEQASKRRKLFSFLEKPDDKETKRSSALLVEFNDFVREQLLLEYDCPLRYWLEKSGTYRCLAQLAYYLCSIPAFPIITRVFFASPHFNWEHDDDGVERERKKKERERYAYDLFVSNRLLFTSDLIALHVTCELPFYIEILNKDKTTCYYLIILVRNWYMLLSPEGYSKPRGHCGQRAKLPGLGA
eukprot:sb/3464535/